MERLLDKLIVTIGCIVVMAASAPSGFAIVSILCAIVASGLFEWIRGTWRTIPADAFLIACLIWPILLPMVPLMAYDAARWREGLGAGEAPSLPAALTAGLCLVALLVAALRLQPAPALLAWLFAALALLLSERTTRALSRERLQRQTEDALRGRGIALAAQNRDLKDRQDYEVDLATMAERGRIARDIHDNVGHLLTRASLQVEALRVAHEADGDPSLDAGLAAVQKTVDEALSSVRESVHALHDGTFDLADRLHEVVGRFEAQSGLAVELSLDFDDAPPSVGMAFLALVKEALTNVARHSDAPSVDVRIVEYPALWQLTVVDDGAAKGAANDAAFHAEDGASASSQRPDGAFGRALAASGMGLAAMEERIIALGGHFASGPRTDGRGWRVFASVPKDRLTAAFPESESKAEGMPL